VQNPVRGRAPFALQRKEYHYSFSLVLSIYQAANGVPLRVGANYHHKYGCDGNRQPLVSIGTRPAVSGVTVMHRASLAAVAIFFAGLTGMLSGAQEKKPDSKQQQKAGKASSMTGCVDEQDGRYVLVDEQKRERIANLEPDGFPVEGFAKHLGHKVIVRGISNAGDALPVFKVRTVETVSENCAPQVDQKQKH